MNIEPLESRIAPASVFRYLDVDTDQITITSSVGDLNGGAVNLFANGGNQCAGLDLGSDFKGANITFTVKKSPGGDGLVNVGYIDAIGVDLGSVTIPGDLGNIDCGDGNPEQPALKSLKVRSIGRFGLATGAGELQSDIAGRLGALTVTGDVVGALISVVDGADGTLGSVKIGGSLIGSSTHSSGTIFSSGDMGPVKVARDVIGGTGSSSGQISSLAKLGAVTVGGSVMGGAGDFSGLIAGTTAIGAVKISRDLIGGNGFEAGAVLLLGTTGQIGKVSIGGSLVGGAGIFSGVVFSSRFGIAADTALADVTIRGSVIGGLGERSGAIFSYNGIGTLTIGRDVIGASGENSGGIDARAVTKSVLIGGSLFGGSKDDTGSISLGTVIGSVKVKGSVFGGVVPSAGGGVLNTGEISVTSASSIVIGGDLVGSSISGSASVSGGGSIFAGGVVGSISIGGSVIAGTDSSTGVLSESGAIFAGAVGTLTIKGDLVGNATNPASIWVPGYGSTDSRPAIGLLTIGGDVIHANIKAAPQVTGNRNSTIAAVKVGGDWVASSLSSGVNPGPGGFYGDFNDTLDAGTISRIRAITIGGDILGTPVGGDFFGFVADEIGSFQSKGLKRANFTGAAPISIETNDVRIDEL